MTTLKFVTADVRFESHTAIDPYYSGRGHKTLMPTTMFDTVTEALEAIAGKCAALNSADAKRIDAVNHPELRTYFLKVADNRGYTIAYIMERYTV